MDRAHRLSVSRQTRLRGISRGSVHDQRRPPSAADLALMRRIDAWHVELSLCWPPEAGGPASAERPEGGPSACRHADEAHGDRGPLSPPHNLALDTGASDL